MDDEEEEEYSSRPLTFLVLYTVAVLALGCFFIHSLTYSLIHSVCQLCTERVQTDDNDPPPGESFIKVQAYETQRAILGSVTCHL